MTPAAPGGPSLTFKVRGQGSARHNALARSYRHKGELGQVPPRRLSEASRLTIMVVRPRTAYLCTNIVRSPGVRFSILSPGPGVDPFLRT